MAARVIPMFARMGEYEGLVCEWCGSAWFAATITVSADGHPTGYAKPLRCNECGEEGTT